jgi:hypothetical protein
MGPLALAGLSAAGSLVSGIFGRRSARRQARAQQEMARRQAEAAYTNQMRNLAANYQMGRQDLIFSTRQALMQEQLNNKVAMENYRYAQKVDDLRLAEMNGNIMRANKQKAAMQELAREGMMVKHVGALKAGSLKKYKAESDLRKQSNAAASKATASAAARGLTPGADASVARILTMTADEAAEARTRMDSEDLNNREVATKQLHLNLARSHLAAQGQALKKKIEGRPPTLFNSSRTMMHLLRRNMSNMSQRYNVDTLNAIDARNAGIANANTAYQGAVAAANSRFMGQAIGAIGGFAGAYAAYGGSTPSSTYPTGSMSNMNYTNNYGVPAGYETGFNLGGQQYGYQTYN